MIATTATEQGVSDVFSSDYSLWERWHGHREGLGWAVVKENKKQAVKG
jgi:hypothetical protein